MPKSQKKHKEKKMDASLFDDNVDIFADLSDTFKPKQKSKTKGETKSIFDDDMGKKLIVTNPQLKGHSSTITIIASTSLWQYKVFYSLWH